MHAPDLGPARWVKSSYSSNTADCVEVGAAVIGNHAGGNRSAMAVRDSKDPDGPALVLATTRWTTFVHALRAREW